MCWDVIERWPAVTWHHVTWPMERNLIGLMEADLGIWAASKLKQMGFKSDLSRSKKINSDIISRDRFAELKTPCVDPPADPQFAGFRLPAKYSLSCLPTKTLQDQTPKGLWAFQTVNTNISQASAGSLLEVLHCDAEASLDSKLQTGIWDYCHEPTFQTGFWTFLFLAKKNPINDSTIAEQMDQTFLYSEPSKL